MDRQELASRWERVFRRMYAVNLYAPGREDYYGIAVTPESVEGERIILRAAFLPGEKYCCLEPGCHFGTWDEKQWTKLRSLMHEEGLAKLGRVAIRIHVTVQEGAQEGLRLPGRKQRLRSSEAYSYWDGPHVEPAPPTSTS